MTKKADQTNPEEPKVEEAKAEKLTKETLINACYVDGKPQKKGAKVLVDAETKERLQNANCITRNRMMTT